MEYLVIFVAALAIAMAVRTCTLARFPEIDLKDSKDSLKEESRKKLDERLNTIAKKVGAKRTSSGKQAESTRQRLEKAGLKMQPDTFSGLTAISTLGFGAAGLLIALLIAPKAGIVVALFAVVVLVSLGMALPSFALSHEIKKRQKRIEADLPASLELLSITVRAGFPLERAVKLVGQRGVGPLAEEFRIVDREVNMLSVPMEKSLDRMAERCGTRGVKAFCLAIKQSYQQGTTITRVLDSQAQIARSKYYANLLVEVNKLPNKMIPVIFLTFFLVLLVMPVVPSIAKAGAQLMANFPQLAALLASFLGTLGIG